jgi:glycosyltransferase 2 family protein
MNPLKNKLFLRIIGIIIFSLILFKLDISKTIDILNQINLKYFIMGLLLFIPHLLIKIYRWEKILNFQGIRIKFKKLISPYVGATGLGIVTPWKVGELTKVSYLRNKNVSLGTASFSVFLDRLLDVCFFFIVGTVGMFFLFSFFKEYLFAISIFLLTIIGTIIFIIYKRHDITKIFLRLLIPTKLKEKMYHTLKELWYEFKKMKGLFIIESLLITALSWLFFYFEVYLFALALNIQLTLWQAIILVSVTSIVNLLPITISGIGTRDATFIFLFTIFGFSSEQAVALSLLILFMWIINALFCMIFWWRKPIKLLNHSS